MRRAAALTVAVLATLGLLFSVSVLVRSDGQPPASVAPRPPTSSNPSVGALAVDPPGDATSREGAVPGEEVRRRPAGLPTAPAVVGADRLVLPAADLDLPVRPVGVARDRQMALPPDPTVLGWYRYGPGPGAGRGSVVVAGHLDSNRFGLGPLVRLRDVEVGDRVRVTRDDGTRRAYVVRSLRRYDRQALPAELFSRLGPERLRIVTCGGAYLPDRGGYQLNLVVTAVPL